MQTKKKQPYRLSLVSALCWLVSSILITSVVGMSLKRQYVQFQKRKNSDPAFIITSIVQTGPQKEALRSEYLAELLGLCVDKPISSYKFNVSLAEQKLLSSPVIQSAKVKIVKPSTVFIDYIVRQPMAWLGDFENIAIDKEGYLFPVYPFFSPKNLPEIFLGLAPFEKIPSKPGLPVATFKKPLQGKYVELAFDILYKLQQMQIQDIFSLKRIDVSAAYEPSLGKRNIVLVIENPIFLSIEGKVKHGTFTHLLRLSTKNYLQELGNYLELREKLIKDDMSNLQKGTKNLDSKKILDFRLPQLAFIKEFIQE